MNSKGTLYTVGAFVVASSLINHVIWRSSLKSMGSFKSPCAFLTDSEFQCLVAIGDALLPSFDDMNMDTLQSSVSGFYNGTLDAQTLKMDSLLSKSSMNHFQRGSLNSGLHDIVALGLQEFLLPDDKKKIATLLTALETSLGCFALTGYCAPFSKLSLNDRVKALCAMRDAHISDVRAGFQALKRIFGNLFLSLSERGKESK